MQKAKDIYTFSNTLIQECTQVYNKQNISKQGILTTYKEARLRLAKIQLKHRELCVQVQGMK